MPSVSLKENNMGAYQENGYPYRLNISWILAHTSRVLKIIWLECFDYFLEWPLLKVKTFKLKIGYKKRREVIQENNKGREARAIVNFKSYSREL